MEHVIKYLFPIFVCGVLPIALVWLTVRMKMNETNRRTQIILAAIEKNAETDIEDLLKKLSPKRRLLKERLLTKLLWGTLATIAGLGLIAFSVYLLVNDIGGSADAPGSMILGLMALGVGVSFLINFVIGKKMLAKELEAEEKALTQQAES